MGSDGNINRLSISGLYTMVDGLESRINGRFNGIMVTAGYLDSQIFNGFAIAGYANIKNMRGLSIALFNRTQHLQRLEIGLLNYAGNNPKILRILPAIDLHLF